MTIKADASRLAGYLQERTFRGATLEEIGSHFGWTQKKAQSVLTFLRGNR